MKGIIGRRPSLLWMMLVPTLLTIAVGFTVFGFYLDRIEYRSRIADVDAELVRAERAFNQRRVQQRSVAADAPAEASRSEVGSPVRIVVSPNGSIAVADAEPSPFDAATTTALAQLDGARTLDTPRYRARTTVLRDGRKLIIALPLASLDDGIADFRRALVAGGAVTLGVQTVVVWLLATVVVRPVTRMTRTATRIAGGELDTPVEVVGGSREIAELAADLDRMLTRLRSALADSETSAALAAGARDDLQRFLADVSHEIRTPLTALRGYSSLYEQGMLEEPYALDRAMDRIGQESDRLHRLVDNMLRLARGQPPVAPIEVFDVADIVHDVVSDLRSAYPTRDLAVDAEPAQGHRMEGTAASIHQAVLNVASNACHHTPPDTAIAIRLRSERTDLVLSVVDHGPGIEAVHVDRIFLPFYQLDPSRSRATAAGAGLGLALTKQIIDHHHGTIAVTTTPGGGTTFTIVVPRSQPGAPDPT